MSGLLTDKTAAAETKKSFELLKSGEISKEQFNADFIKTIENLDPQRPAAPSVHQSTYFWSGKPDPDAPGHSSDFANGASESIDNGRAIDGLHYRNFLSNKDVQEAYKAVNGFSIDDAGRFSEAPWVVASIELAKTSSGDVVALSFRDPNAEPDGILYSVFIKHDLPELIKNIDVKTVNGVPKSELQTILKGFGGDYDAAKATLASTVLDPIHAAVSGGRL